MRASRNIVIAAVLALTGACTTMPQTDPADYTAAPLENYPAPPPAEPTGAILQHGSPGMVLFEDVKARQVGDILTVLLAESTDAAKSSDTTLGKSSDISIPNPILAGKLRDFGDDNTLEFDVSSDTGFEGESESNQSNSLQGSITVTVVQVLPGGNLFVQGEKWIQINQGSEFIRLQGIVRPVDISANNAVLSTKIADARISYSGTGSTADVNRVGWLSRFFVSPWWPF